MDKPRVLIISHGHPDQTPGGGQHAAYDLFAELQGRRDVDALFLAHTSGPEHVDTPFGVQGITGAEILMTSRTDYFRFSQSDLNLACNDFRGLLDWFRPSVVHVHHYIHVGIELLRVIRNYSSQVPIVLTLHEYLAICNHNGQMIKTRDNELCRAASPRACNGCFPTITPEEFMLRELYIKSFFEVVDSFISPSKFLIDRYVAWGLPREKMVLLENGLPAGARAAARTAPAGGRRSRFGFFGQISPYKGLDVLLSAVMLLPLSERTTHDAISIDVHGGFAEAQPQSFHQNVEKQLIEVRDCVRAHGRYHRDQLAARMSGVDWVVVPSIWWENSPLVIQEAFAHGRPVICSNIGGMAEKVMNGVNGLHFRVGDARHLADRLLEAARTQGLWERLHAGIQPPPTIAETTERHLELYERIRESKCRSVASSTDDASLN